MSLFSKSGRISVKPFAAVPEISELGLETISRPEPSISDVSSNSGGELAPGIPLREGCLITKTIKYTHQLVHWVNAVRNGDPAEVEHFIQSTLGIVPYEGFSLSDPCNLSFLEAYLHISLDLYAFIAITPSLATADSLIAMVRADNQRRQDILDKEGFLLHRTLDFLSPSFRDPSFELVALHPRHFLPQPGNVLSIYDPVGNLFRHYAPAHDLCLRETMADTSDPLPTIFPPQRRSFSAVNVFLVAINAEIKLRRFEAANPSLPLPPSHVVLARRTMELVDLLYWKPRPTQGSRGAELIQAVKAARQNPTRRSQPKTGSTKESSQDEPEPAPPPPPPPLVRKRRNLSYPADADLETRMAYGRALMCGHDRDYPPELFEDAVPLPDVAPLYSREEDLQTWRNHVDEAADVQTDGINVPRS